MYGVRVLCLCVFKSLLITDLLISECGDIKCYSSATGNGLLQNTMETNGLTALTNEGHNKQSRMKTGENEW
jgi:hypothetical protein